MQLLHTPGAPGAATRGGAHGGDPGPICGGTGGGTHGTHGGTDGSFEEKNGITDASSTADCCPLLSIVVNCCPLLRVL